MQTVHTIGRLGTMGSTDPSVDDGTGYDPSTDPTYDPSADPTSADGTTYDPSADPSADGTTYDASADGTTYDPTSTAAASGISRGLVIGATIGAFVLGLVFSLANER